MPGGRLGLALEKNEGSLDVWESPGRGLAGAPSPSYSLHTRLASAALGRKDRQTEHGLSPFGISESSSSL